MCKSIYRIQILFVSLLNPIFPSFNICSQCVLKKIETLDIKIDKLHVKSKESKITMCSLLMNLISLANTSSPLKDHWKLMSFIILFAQWHKTHAQNVTVRYACCFFFLSLYSLFSSLLNIVDSCK